jgi:hypothetical protein
LSREFDSQEKPIGLDWVGMRYLMQHTDRDIILQFFSFFTILPAHKSFIITSCDRKRSCV